MRSPGRRVALTVACVCWIACAQRTALTTLSNSPKTESPAVSTTHPSCASTRDWVRVWKSRISAVVPSSSRPIIRLKPETSTIRIAESLRRGVEASVVICIPHTGAGPLGLARSLFSVNGALRSARDHSIGMSDRGGGFFSRMRQLDSYVDNLYSTRIVKKLMRLRACSISGALRAVHDTASGLGALRLDLLLERVGHSLSPDDSARDENAPHTASAH